MADGRKGLVLSVRRGTLTVESGGEIFVCRAGTKMRKAEGRILAGDEVIFRDNGGGNGFITDFCERRNSLIRPRVANIDLLVIAASPKEPEPYVYNIDLLTVIARKNEIDCAIVVTKNDFDGGLNLKEIYSKTPFKVVETSAKDGHGIEEVLDLFKGRKSVICGASGVGKSTLLNAAFPELSLETGELSERIARGKNTTRVTELFPLGESTYLADTPGFTAVDTELYCAIDHKELHTLFPEFEEFENKCRYADCTHTKETECGIAEAVEKGLISATRAESYKKLYYELKNIDRYR